MRVENQSSERARQMFESWSAEIELLLLTETRLEEFLVWESGRGRDSDREKEEKIDTIE